MKLKIRKSVHQVCHCGTGSKIFTALPTLTPHPVRAEAAYPFALVANKFAAVYLFVDQSITVCVVSYLFEGVFYPHEC